MTTTYCGNYPDADHTNCPSSVECNHTAIAETIADVPADTLQARVRYAGWKPADLRINATMFDDGCHVASAHIDDEQAATAATKLRAEADRLEVEGAAAQVELDRRRAARPHFAGYVA